MAPKESERDDTRSFLGEHGSTRILTYFLDEMSTRPKVVSARTRTALVVAELELGALAPAHSQRQAL